MKLLSPFLLLVCVALTTSQAAMQKIPPDPRAMAVAPANRNILHGTNATVTLSLLWTPSVSPGVAYTAIYAATNSQASPLFISTNHFAASTGTVSNLPLCRLYLFMQAVGSNGLSSQTVLGTSFSGFGNAFLFYLTESNALGLSMVYRLTNAPGVQAYFRLGTNALQESTNLLTSQWKNIYPLTNGFNYRMWIGRVIIPIP